MVFKRSPGCTVMEKSPLPGHTQQARKNGTICRSHKHPNLCLFVWQYNLGLSSKAARGWKLICKPSVHQINCSFQGLYPTLLNIWLFSAIKRDNIICRGRSGTSWMAAQRALPKARRAYGKQWLEQSSRELRTNKLTTKRSLQSKSTLLSKVCEKGHPCSGHKAALIIDINHGLGIHPN